MLRYIALLLIGSVSVYRIFVYLGSVIPACLLGVVFAWCIGVYYYFNLCYILAICVRGVGIGYMLFISLVLACSFVAL